jgi:hypothetical protein
MKSATIAAIIILFLVLDCQAFALTGFQSTTIHSSGTIFVDEKSYVKPFGFRIADMMADLIQPNFDDESSASQWQAALNDLAAASPNGEITHVQMRIWWDLQDGFIVPQLYSTDSYGNLWGGQWVIMNNETWKRWYFGYIAPGQPPLAYGPSAVQRIHGKGFKFELAISGAWENGDMVKPGGDHDFGGSPSTAGVGGWGAREANNANWTAAGGGDQFLTNYENNVLLPVANFVKDYLQDGDIFCMSFEMSYPTADFTWSHNSKWVQIINDVRQVFRSAGKRIVLTLDHCGWFDDSSLGYTAVKILNPNAPIDASQQGISGASYLGNLDFVSVSWWLPLILQEQVPANWTDADIPWVTNAWFNNTNFDSVGIPRIAGRDMIADLRAFSQVTGRLVIMNTGWENRHGFLYTSPSRYSSNTPDNEEQRVAWAAQLAAIQDPRSNFTAWCAGQDFERYCRDKSAEPDFIDTSWRNAPAESAIIAGIRSIVDPPAESVMIGGAPSMICPP